MKTSWIANSSDSWSRSKIVKSSSTRMNFKRPKSDKKRKAKKEVRMSPTKTALQTMLNEITRIQTHLWLRSSIQKSSGRALTGGNYTKSDTLTLLQYEDTRSWWTKTTRRTRLLSVRISKTSTIRSSSNTEDLRKTWITSSISRN